MSVAVAVAAPISVQTPAGRQPHPGRAQRVRRWLALLAVWIVSAAYVGTRLDRGWVPMDEGTIAHSAERVLAGELPHRDFDDVYTGGLAQLDAAVFRVLGTRLVALRLAMFAVFLLWIPAVYYIATRFARSLAAAGVTLLCVVWSIPTYPAAMPSAYNLFLATFGTAALFRFTETRHQRWLIAAGVAGGLSIVIKIVGLYYIAAALLFFAFDEHRTAVARPRPEPVHGDRGYALFVTLGCALFVVALLYLVRAVPGESRLLHYVLPGALLVALLTATEWREPAAEPWPRRVRRLSGLVGPFALGAAVPVALFLYPYVVSGSVAALVHGVFIEPLKRYRFTVVPPASLFTLPAAIPWLLVLVPPAVGGTARDAITNRAAVEGSTDRIVIGAYVAVLSALALATLHGGRAYVGAWMTAYYVVPCAVAAGCLVLAQRSARLKSDEVQSEQLWLLLCVTAMCSLIQVPYAGWGTILYFAPIAILALLAIVMLRQAGPGPRPAIVAGFYLVYGMAAVNPGHVTPLGSYLPPEAWARVPLDIPRTGLRSSAAMAERYERVVTLLRGHSRPGAFIYAAPDCPELYFLSQRRDPSRALFDFFDDSAGHDDRVVRAVDSLHVTAVAINTSPGFSRPIDTVLSAALRGRFPDSAVVDNFVVRWRSDR